MTRRRPIDRRWPEEDRADPIGAEEFTDAATVASELVTTFAPSATARRRTAAARRTSGSASAGCSRNQQSYTETSRGQRASAGRRSSCRARRRDVPSKRSIGGERRAQSRSAIAAGIGRRRCVDLMRARMLVTYGRSSMSPSSRTRRSSRPRRCRCRCAARGAVRRRSPRSGAWVHRHADAAAYLRRSAYEP